jgi:hypothetical protein
LATFLHLFASSENIGDSGHPNWGPLLFNVNNTAVLKASSFLPVRFSRIANDVDLLCSGNLPFSFFLKVGNLNLFIYENRHAKISANVHV